MSASSATTVVAFIDSADEAERIVAQLRAAAVPSSAISVLLPTPESAEGIDDDATKAPEGAVAGVGTGGIIGGALGWLTGVGIVAIPGLGAFLAAGPLMAALSGAAVGATVGGVAGALVGLGLPENETKRSEAQLRAGRILLSVRVATDAEAAAARRIFSAAGAEEVGPAADGPV